MKITITIDCDPEIRMSDTGTPEQHTNVEFKAEDGDPTAANMEFIRVALNGCIDKIIERLEAREADAESTSRAE